MVKQIWTLSVVHEFRGLEFFAYKSEIISPLHREALSEELVYKNGILGSLKLISFFTGLSSFTRNERPFASVPVSHSQPPHLTQPQGGTYRGVVSLHWEFIQVAVGLVFLDGAVDSRLTTVSLRDGEEDGESCQDAVHCGRAVLRLSA